MIPATYNPARAAMEKLRRERTEREAAIAASERHKERWAPVWESVSDDEKAQVREAAIGGNPFLQRQHERHGDTG